MTHHDSYRRAVAPLACLALLLSAHSSHASAHARRAGGPPEAAALRPTVVAAPVDAMRFEPNVGQVDASVRYVAHGGNYAVLLHGDGATLSVGGAKQDTRGEASGRRRGREPQGADVASRETVRMRFAGARESVVASAERPLASYSNYVKGDDPARWRSNVPNFGAVRFAGVYDGVDALFYGTDGALEYDFVVAPGADPGRIRVRFEGQRAARVDASGRLVLTLRGGEVVQRAAAVYQEAGGSKRRVAARYVAGPDGEIGFAVVDYDRTRPLVIDPILEYGDFLGGATGEDHALALAIDASGASYVAGETASTDFVSGSSGYDATYDGSDFDGFVAKLAPDGRSVVYKTFLGSSDSDVINGIAVDASGAAYVVGTTTSLGTVSPVSNFPVTPGAFDTTHNGGQRDAFAAKLSPDGASLVYSTFLGGAGDDYAYGVAVDPGGHAYVTGWTHVFDSQTPFPTTPGAYDKEPYSNDVFVTKLAADGSSLAYSTLLPGGYGDAIAVDAQGHAFVGVHTFPVPEERPYPTTPGAYDTNYSETDDAYDAAVTEFDATGSSLVFSTFLGTADGDETVGGIAVGADGTVTLTGLTTSYEFPTTDGAADRTLDGDWDGFATRFDPTGSSLVFSTFLGGGSYDAANAVAYGPDGSAYVAGWTESADFATTSGAYQTAYNGGVSDAFVTKLTTTGALSYSTLLGGDRLDAAYGIRVDASGAAYVAGDTSSLGFPVDGAAPPVRDDLDVFVSKLSPSGGSLAYSAIVGGVRGIADDGLDAVDGLAVDASGATYVAGTTASVNFPTTPGAFETAGSAYLDGYVSKVSPDGASLVYSTYFGGDYADSVYDLGVDASGSPYVVGLTSSFDYPTTPGAFRTSHAPGENYDVFVTKLTPDGASPAYSTYLAVPGHDPSPFGYAFYAMAVAPNGAAYVFGQAAVSAPVTAGAYDTTASANGDMFVAKLAPSGASLVYCTYLGGSGADVASDIVVDGTGAAYVSVLASSFDYPTTAGAYRTDFPGTQSAAVTKLAPDGASLVYSTFLGGGMTYERFGLAVDAAGSAAVVGGTYSPDFPTTDGTGAELGGRDAFVSKFSPDGSSLVFSSRLGGEEDDEASGVAYDSTGEIYLTGRTMSEDFPVTADAVSTKLKGPSDAFLMRVSPVTGARTSSSYLGGAGRDWAYEVETGTGGAVWLAGATDSADFPSTGFGVRNGTSGFLVKLRGAAGRTTPGAYVASSGAWFLRDDNSPGPADSAFAYGAGGAGLIPLAGDWNGDGVDSVGVYQPATSTFFLKNSNASGGADLAFQFGAAGGGYVPLAGDWDGDGVDTIGLYQPATGVFFLRDTNGPGAADLAFTFGGVGGVRPIVGDWDGDGVDTIGLYAAGGGAFFLRNSNTPGPADVTFTFGAPGGGYVALAGDWDGDGRDTVGICAQSTATWFLTNANASGPAAVSFVYGASGLTPLVGNWDGR